MFIPRLYINMPLMAQQELQLDKDKTHYLTNVIRAQNNEPLIVFNGQGGEYAANLKLNKKSACLSINEFIDINRESKIDFHLGQGILRGDKMDLVIQKATELGVAAITPLLIHHAKVKLDKDREVKRVLHWQQIAISACEQSGRTKLPIINTPQTLEEWTNTPFEGLSIVFDAKGTKSLKIIPSTSPIRIATGPESGWIHSEIEKLTQAGFSVYHLGNRILRAETASIVALSALHALIGDF